MSTRYPGGFITRNPVAPTSASASGIWTQDQVLQYVRSGTWPQVYVPIYIEDVFSTYLYTGTGSSQTITNGIDLSGKGGLVWVKSRSVNNNCLVDTVRGASNTLQSDLTTANVFASTVTAFSSSGFTVGTSGLVSNSNSYASWTFREQPKFFDIVTYTGDGASSKSVSHNLGSTPGCVIVKRTDSTSFWLVWHRGFSSPSVSYGYLNSTDPFQTDSPNNNWAAAPTSTTFTPASNYNVNGATYVAYLFAHNAGGFGLTGADNVISCGSFTGAATNVDVELGWEPQWVLIKRTNSADGWRMYDNMRGMTASNGGQLLYANNADAEVVSSRIKVYATGFGFTDDAANTNIYIAIRRGPMKTPTSGTSVFGLSARSGTGANATVTGSAGVSDAVLIKNRGSAVGDLFAARLTGTGYLETSSTAAEVAAGTTILQANPWDVMDGVKVGTTSNITNATSNTYINYLFDRAPGFFDVVCYTGTSTVTTQAHNLGVAPELMIIKSRGTAATNWAVYSRFTSTTYGYQTLQTNSGGTSNIAYGPGGSPNFESFSAAPTASLINLSSTAESNFSGRTYVAYLFATVGGVSKVGSYTGTGTTLQVDCGFTAGSRFVMIKRTDSTGDWYVWDSARGIVAGNDPYLLLNSTAAEVTNTDYVDTYNAGFEISSTAPAGLNANGGTYIFLAIA